MANINTYLRQLHLNNHARQFCTKVNSNLTSKSPIQSDRDLIGPPDSISNLRPIIFAKSDRETELEKKYRETREATQEWNQRFWTKHNTNFSHERKQFKELLKKEGNNSTLFL
ncbi:apoptogenic protein 1, mitochondrial isoform X5 [Cephus cinctus]|uniref:Apoptogenic protein 1, mitochondrial isoform X5 n=1 Tax=Cephus cinctus TaxID=211228 RepID=A0AAJ7RSB8_CEPCN|nr:apoptogenic protein 1, mitochondrial isoform X5 [Cephus cinctus]